MDFERLAQQWVRALRGRRSQRAFSRWLGYRTNVVYTWESGRRYPTAAEALRVAERARVDVRGALGDFVRAAPLGKLDPASPEGVAELLRTLAGNTPVADLARRSGLSRHAIGRWMRGEAQPRLPQLFRLVEAESLRVLDFVACFVDPARLPCVAERWADLVARRAVARESPWSQAVLRALELEAYRRFPKHPAGWIAGLLGISAEEEARCLEMLLAAGQVSWERGRYRTVEGVTLDTRADPQAGRRLRRHWSEVAIEAIERERPGLYSYNVFSVSRADFERLREMHLAYFRALRAVVANSTPEEVVAVANVQLFALEEDQVPI